MQVFVFGPVEIHKVPVNPFLQLVLLYGSPAVKRVDWSPQFGIISKADESTP